jgi:hypothetical protein
MFITPVLPVSVPVMVSPAPAVMLPLESSVMLFVALVGWVTLMVFNVLMAASY